MKTCPSSRGFVDRGATSAANILAVGAIIVRDEARLAWNFTGYTRKTQSNNNKKKIMSPLKVILFLSIQRSFNLDVQALAVALQALMVLHHPICDQLMPQMSPPHVSHLVLIARMV